MNQSQLQDEWNKIVNEEDKHCPRFLKRVLAKFKDRKIVQLASGSYVK